MPASASIPVARHLFEKRHALIKSLHHLGTVVAMLKDAMGDRYDLDIMRVVVVVRARIADERAELAVLDGVVTHAEGRIAV